MIQNKYSVILFWILKFLGILIITHNGISDSLDKTSLGCFIRRIFFFQNMNAPILNYNGLCIFIYLLIFIFFGLFFISYKKDLSNKKNFSLKIISFLFTSIVFLSGHLIEILSIVFLNLFIGGAYTTNNSNSKDQSVLKTINFFNDFNDNLLISNYILLVLNSICIILINYLLFMYLKYSNDRFVSSISSLKYSFSKTFRFCVIIISNLNAVHYLDIIFPNLTYSCYN